MDFIGLTKRWERFYYAEVLLILTELIALILGLIYARKDKAGKWFIFYIAFDFCMIMIGYYFEFGPEKLQSHKRYFTAYANTMVSLVELLVYNHFFRMVLKDKRIKLLLKLINWLFLIIVVIFIITRFEFISFRYSYISNILGVFEFVLLLPFCILYYIQTFNKISALSLSERPSFWIITGIFFFSAISIPYYLLENFFRTIKFEFRHILAATFYFMPFIINFIFLSKAFICKKALTT